MTKSNIMTFCGTRANMVEAWPVRHLLKFTLQAARRIYPPMIHRRVSRLEALIGSFFSITMSDSFLHKRVH